MPKNKKNIRLILIILLVVFSTLLTVVLYLFPIIRYSTAAQKVKKIYFAENITPTHLQLINKFNKENKGEIEVIPINLPYKKFSTNKRKELITKNLRNRTSRIDIYAIDVVWGERFIKWAEPLNKYFSNDEINRIFAAAKHYCYSDSVLYSVPFFADVGILYYREDLLKKAKNFKSWLKKIKRGITWHELDSINIPNCRNKYLFQSKAYEGLMCNFLEIAGKNSFYNTDSEIIGFKKNIIIPKLNYVRNLIYKFKIIPKKVTNFDESETFSFALENDIPFFRGWPTGEKNIQIPEKLRSKLKCLKIAPLPRFAGDSTVSTVGGWNLIVSRNSNYKKESVKFIKFMLSKSSQKLLWEKNGYLPILKTFYSNSKYLSKYPELKLCYSLINKGVFRIKHPQYTRISDILTANLNKFFRNEISAEKFIDNTTTEIRSIKNRFVQ